METNVKVSLPLYLNTLLGSLGSTNKSTKTICAYPAESLLVMFS